VTTLAGVKSIYIEFRKNVKTWLILLRKLLDDLDKLPTFQNVLKYVSISCKADIPPTLKNRWIGVFHRISKLHTHPVLALTMDGWIGDLNNISKMYFIDTEPQPPPSFLEDFLTTYKNLHLLEKIKNSCLIDFGIVACQIPLFADDIVTSNLQYHIERPSDLVSFVDTLQQAFASKQEKLILPPTQLCSQYAFELRYNRGIMQNFNAVIFTLRLNWRFCRHATLWGGWWARLPREILNHILGFLHPMQWKLAEAEKPRKRFAVKTPKHANDILKQYKETRSKQDELESVRGELNDIQGEEARVKLKIKQTKKILESLRQELTQVPLKRLTLQNNLNDAQRAYEESYDQLEERVKGAP
jgi:hypothetical protein